MDGWVSTCGGGGARCGGEVGGLTSVDEDMEALGLHPEWAVFRDVWRGFIWANVQP